MNQLPVNSSTCNVGQERVIGSAICTCLRLTVALSGKEIQHLFLVNDGDFGFAGNAMHFAGEGCDLIALFYFSNFFLGVDFVEDL